MKGNFDHNIAVLKRKEGILFVSRRPQVKKVVEDYTPCRYCLDFVTKSELWRHIKSCEFNVTSLDDEDDDGSNSQRVCLKASSAMLQGLLCTEHQGVLLEIVERMRKDEVRLVVKGDTAIMTYGAIQLKKLGPERRYDIAQKMRQMGRLLIELRKVHSSGTTMSIIDSDMFDDVVKATVDLCGLDEGTTLRGVEKLKSPSFGIHMGNLLSKFVGIKESNAIRLKDRTALEECDFFLRLLRREWNDAIALRTKL